jgi:hypothetical protein
MSTGKSAGPSQSAATVPRTPWGHPDLQAIWHEDLETPLQRDPKYGDRDSLTDQEVKPEDARKAASITRDRRKELDTDADVAAADPATRDIATGGAD